MAGLTPGTTYEFQVKAQCSNGLESSYGEINTFSTEDIGAFRLRADLGIEETGSIHDLRLYPNPSNGQVTLEMNVEESLAQLILHDISGRTVHQQTLQVGPGYVGSFNFGLESGAYIMQITGEHMFETIFFEVK